jgi:hypothetical protein
MWAIEGWDLYPEGLVSPVLACGRDSVISCYKDDLIVRRRGDCPHQLRVRSEILDTNLSGDSILLYCALCERPVETHVSEIPSRLVGEVDLLLGDQIHWCRVVS